ncbi:hypothetical protein WJX75_002097 [Coccomyxa subellipsoidea]|uniref:DUF4042 domain-containing protein n=1 Tax=Coccomyxa subellipsoidea TaxID=248742 RepID=A0ABR2YX42_9CHLO
MGSDYQHFNRVCCNLRKPLESLLQEDQPDALRGMVNFLSLHASKVSDTEVVALITDLLKVARTKGTGDMVAEVHKLTIQALGYLVTECNPGLPATSLRDVAAYLCEVLAGRLSDSSLPLDRASSHLIYSPLRLLQAIIPQAKDKQVISLSPLLDSLRKLPSAYRPPHARRRSSHKTAPSLDSSPSSRPSGSWRCEDGGYSSASDASDSDGGSVGSSPSSTSLIRVRLTALSCLQALARVDGKALHPFWAVLFPVQAPLARRPDSFTLMDAVVNDPAPKVRAAAASAVAALLEGAPQRAYLGIAECRLPAKQPARGFTTLSATLGKLALSLHDGLLQAAASEADPAALTAVLRSLHVLICSAPYARLPPTLLSRTLSDVHRCCTRLQSGVHRAGEETAPAQAAALSCIAAALNTDAGRRDLVELLSLGHPGAVDAPQSQGSDFGARLADDLVKLCAGAPLVVRTEALSALQALAICHWALIGGHWKGLRTAMLSTLETGGEERCALNALRLLGSYMKTNADVTQSGDAACKDPCDQESGSGGMPLAEEWRDALASIIPKGVEHPVPAVRAAAMSALASLDQTVCAALSVQELQHVWGWLLSCAKTEPAAAVRAAALKTAGGLAQLKCSLDYPGAAAMLGMIYAGLRDSTLSVQIAAAWALANLADVITQRPMPDAVQCSSIADAALGAADSGDKVRANAVRAIGYIVAAGPQSSNAQTQPQHQSSTCNGAHAPQSSGEAACAAALATGNGKVQWNACYAIGSLLRRTDSVAAADACGCLLTLLAQLLDVLQHSANFKTRMHAAAALCAVSDGRWIAQLQPDIIVGLKSALQGLDHSDTQAAEGLSERI